jgi:phage FluMu gp28-like protein
MTAIFEALASHWTPHHGQRAFLEADSRLRVLACGRRWGKTDACAAWLLQALLGDEECRAMILAPTVDQARLLFDRTRRFLRWAAPRRKVAERKTPYPRLEVGGRALVARSGHLGRSLRGNEATHLVIDEAAFLPESAITEVAMPMLATTNGRMVMISTPNGLNHFWRFYRMGAEGRHGVWSRAGPSWESPHVSPSYLAVQRDLISERAYRIEYGAEFLDSVGRVFPTEAIDRCLAASLPAATGPFFIGIDWARYSDQTAVAVLEGTAEEARLVRMEAMVGLPWSAQIARVAEIAREHPGARVLCDATGMGDPALERLREAIPEFGVDGLVFTPTTKAELIDRLAWTLEQGRLAMAPDPALMRELQHFEARSVDGGPPRLGASGGYHDDRVVALALAVRQLPRAYGGRIQIGAARGF